MTILWTDDPETSVLRLSCWSPHSRGMTPETRDAAQQHTGPLEQGAVLCEPGLTPLPASP